jgi:hypothetical protein
MGWALSTPRPRPQPGRNAQRRQQQKQQQQRGKHGSVSVSRSSTSGSVSGSVSGTSGSGSSSQQPSLWGYFAEGAPAYLTVVPIPSGFATVSYVAPALADANCCVVCFEDADDLVGFGHMLACLLCDLLR